MKSRLLTFVFALGTLAAFGQQKPVYSDAEAGKHVGEEVTVTGKVINVSITGGGTTFLNFGDRFPKNTFGGVIFAGKKDAVGDVKQYEGKEVAVTGRIELDKNQKPQIVISTADQIKLTGAANPPAATTPAPAPAAAAPMPAAASAPVRPAVPTPAASVVTPTAKQTGRIALAAGWKTNRPGGEKTRKDLAKLFGGTGSASETTDVDTSIEVYPGLPFLTPLASAKKILHLEAARSSTSKISTPGLPQESFSATVFTGIFPGGFERLYLITDSADQVVSAMLMDAGSRTRVANETDVSGYHTYNFVTGSSKASNNLVVKHELTPPSAASKVAVVETMLFDPTDPEPKQPGTSTKGSFSKSTKPKTGKVLERSRWYVPAPVVNLILRCVGG